jgi:hypothetical protein
MSAFSSEMKGVDLKEIQETIMNNATINVGDRTYDLNDEYSNAF